MQGEFDQAFVAWMKREGIMLLPPGLAKAGQDLIFDLMLAAWFAGGVAADQQHLDRMRATETKA